MDEKSTPPCITSLDECMHARIRHAHSFFLGIDDFVNREASKHRYFELDHGFLCLIMDQSLCNWRPSLFIWMQWLFAYFRLRVYPFYINIAYIYELKWSMHTLLLHTCWTALLCRRWNSSYSKRKTFDLQSPVGLTKFCFQTLEDCGKVGTPVPPDTTAVNLINALRS